VEELEKIGFDGYTTLEVAGEENVRRSVERLKDWSCRVVAAP
jgi:sugar phosphate isomerase/epimerase